MCGRYFFNLESELLQNYYREAQKKQPEQAAELAAGEIFPSNLVVTLRKKEENNLTPEIMKWGFTGFKKGQLMINARAETIEEKKTFHQPFLQNRCVFPMSGFYEWNEEKDKFMFSNKEKIVYIGGKRKVQVIGHGVADSSWKYHTEQKILKPLMNSSNIFLLQKYKKNSAKKVLTSWQARQPTRI